MTDRIILENPGELMEIFEQVKEEAVNKYKDHL